MASCKDCIHNVICSADAYFKEREGAETACIHFKNKADFVEVVRCKDCKHKVDFMCRVMCSRNAQKHGDEYYHLTATDNEHFCNYGERKEK